MQHQDGNNLLQVPIVQDIAYSNENSQKTQNVHDHSPFCNDLRQTSGLDMQLDMRHGDAIEPHHAACRTHIQVALVLHSGSQTKMNVKQRFGTRYMQLHLASK